MYIVDFLVGLYMMVTVYVYEPRSPFLVILGGWWLCLTAQRRTDRDSLDAVTLEPQHLSPHETSHRATE